MLLRPFFRAPSDARDTLDASKWEFCDLTDDTANNDSSWFPGTFRGRSQLASPESHPHLRLKECMVNIPTMYPGDTVWWHTDVKPLPPTTLHTLHKDRSRHSRKTD